MDALACYQKFNGFNKLTYENSLKQIKKLLENKNANEEYLNYLIILFGNIREQMGKNNNLIQNMSYEEILKKIEDYLPVKKIEKDKHGEVFTPPKLIVLLENTPSLAIILLTLITPKVSRFS